MGAYKKPAYEIQEKFWVVSEIKASMIEVFNNFVKKRDVYVRSLQTSEFDPRLAKSDIVSALYEFYNMMVNGFLPYLDHLEKEKLTKYKEEDYKKLAIKRDHNDEDLVEMAYILNKWAFCEGPFRITHQEKVFDNILDKVAEENDM